MNGFDFYYGCLVGVLLSLLPSALFVFWMMLAASRAAKREVGDD